MKHYKYRIIPNYNGLFGKERTAKILNDAKKIAKNLINNDIRMSSSLIYIDDILICEFYRDKDEIKYITLINK